MSTITQTRFDAPIVSAPMHVEPAWIDLNGHMNLAYYQVLFDRHLDHVLTLLDLHTAYLERCQHSVFAAEVHLCYKREVTLEDPVTIAFRLLAADDKRLHFYSEMRHASAGWLACTSENLSLHVDMQARKAAPFLPETRNMLAAMVAAHAALPAPAAIGRRIAMPVKA